MANTIPSIHRVVKVMQSLAAGGETTSLGLARRLGISQSSCYRILRTLEAANWICREAGGQYVFASGLMPFVKPLVGIERAVDCLRSDMESLSLKAGLTVKLSVREGVEQVTVARVECHRPLSATSPIGTRFPVVLGASGACLLSGVDRASLAQLIEHADKQRLWGHDSKDLLLARLKCCRKSGHCENIGSHPQGIDTVSAPLATSSRTMALTLVGLRGDFDGKRLSQCRRLLLATVAAVKPKLKALP